MHVIHTVFSSELGRIFKQEMSMKVCTEKRMSNRPNAAAHSVSRMARLLLWPIASAVKRRTLRAQLPSSLCGFPSEWPALNPGQLNSSNEDGCALITGKFYIKGEDIFRNALFCPSASLPEGVTELKIIF